MPLLDTREKGINTTGKLISDIVLQLLAYVAETEREFIHQRQQEGIEAARAKGIRFGRPALEKPQNYSQIFDLWKECKISAREAARRLGVNHKTFLKWAREI
jgi:DNA invertase Pin-like site-specific DNA recombinase